MSREYHFDDYEPADGYTCQEKFVKANEDRLTIEDIAMYLGIHHTEVAPIYDRVFDKKTEEVMTEAEFKKMTDGKRFPKIHET